MSLTIKDRYAFITGNYSGNIMLRAGDEVLSIDGMPVAQKLYEIHHFLSGEGAAIKNTLIELIAFPRVYWWIYGTRQQYAVTVKQKDGYTKRFIVKAIRASTFEAQAGKQKPVFSLERKFKLIGNIGYLHPGIFINNKSSGNTSEQETFKTNEFISFVDSSFRELRNAKVQDLIIDLRGNPGGDNAFSDPMIAYFASKPFWFCSRFSVKTSAVTKQFWKDVNEPSLRELKEEILSRKDGEVFTVSFQNYRPKPDSLRFKGKVYVLVDRFSYSNTVSVAAIVQDYHFGVVLGEATADVASSYGATHEFSLPHSGLFVSYPKAFIVRPNGDTSLKGVSPNVLVEDNVFTEKDEILDYAINYINKQRYQNGTQ